MRRRQALLTMIALAAAIAAAGCSKRHAAPATPVQQARRVVSLAPSTTEALFALGAGGRVVGRSSFCDFPPEATKLPALGGVEPDLEAILELQPDLVVGLSGVASERLEQKLAARGIATWFPHTESLAEIDALLVGLGERAGHSADAVRVVAEIDAREEAVTNAVAGEPRPRVLLVAGLGPVVVAGPASFADEMIRRAGGANVVTDGGGWPVVGFERVVELDPDVVVDVTVAESGGATRITPETPGWSGVRAVREGHVVPLGDERVLRAGPRIADGLAVLARTLHPGAPLPGSR